MRNAFRKQVKEIEVTLFLVLAGGTIGGLDREGWNGLALQAQSAFQAGEKSQATSLGSAENAAPPVQWEAVYSKAARLGNYKKAIQSYQRALQIQPNLVDTLVNLGVNQALLGHNSNAIKAFKQAIRLRPDDAEAHSHLVVCYWNKGERIQALQELQILKNYSPVLASQISDNLATTYTLDAHPQLKGKKQSSAEKSVLDTVDGPAREK